MTSGCRALRVGPTSWQPTPLISVYCEVCVVGQVPRRDGQQSQTAVTASSWLEPHEPMPRNDTNMHSATMEEFRPRVLTGP